MTVPEPSLIELHQVQRAFGSQQVLVDVSLAVRAGETLAIIGESGCGKSVTTKLMAALLEPTAGVVSWSGRPLADLTSDERKAGRLRMGYLFQGAALFDSLNVYENVAFGLRQSRKMAESEIYDVVVSRLRETGLPAQTIHKRPAELSGGMRKRVGLARALALDPALMIYDEPTTGLDPVMSDVINELILQTRTRTGMTSIVVTHDMQTVRRVATRVVMLQPASRLEPGESQVLYEGSAADVFHAADARVQDFVWGRAGRRLEELFAA